MPDWLDPELYNIVHAFKDLGYKTGHFGKWQQTDAGLEFELPNEKPNALGYTLEITRQSLWRRCSECLQR